MYMSEKWFVRDSLNLEAEALKQLRSLDVGLDGILSYKEGEATQAARVAYASERVRLLYVGITRAKRDLIITWNTGRKGDLQPATPFIALQAYWEEKAHGAAS